MKSIKKMTQEEVITYITTPIIQVLQEAGGRLDRSEIEKRICEKDDEIAEYAAIISTSKKTGNQYSKFRFNFNFAIKNLSFQEYLEFEKRKPAITLTDKGMNVDLQSFDPYKEVTAPSNACWEKLKKDKKTAVSNEEIISNDVGLAEQYNDEFKEKLLTAISKMSPKKFEQFSRLLIGKMGVEFTNEGTQVSNDGGIDGCGYHRDSTDFRTTKVVIQCKRYNSASVGEPKINEFLGAMKKFNADYGIMITNSFFTKAAKKAALDGGPVTLIDGDELVKLIKEYKFYIKPVITYELDPFYDEDN